VARSRVGIDLGRSASPSRFRSGARRCARVSAGSLAANPAPRGVTTGLVAGVSSRGGTTRPARPG
jgi:hypothetical protein